MKIEATLFNTGLNHTVTVNTNGAAKELPIPAKAQGSGSSVNGGELLFAALATCYCNDIYREAARRAIEVRSVLVTVSGDFGGEGEPARRIDYSVKIDSPNSADEIEQLLIDVDRVAEIHNTLRAGIAVTLQR